MHYLLLALGLVVIVNLIAFIFAYKWQTDKLTDITYSICFFLLAFGFWYWNGDTGWQKTLLMAMPALWSIRLGSYLFLRIHNIGVDHRFDDMRPVWYRYLRFWILQALSIWIIALPFVITLNKTVAINFAEYQAYIFGVGFTLWLLGWILQSIADLQKYRFKQNTENKGKFFSQGLFKHIRHPNYLGEIMIWSGIFIFCTPYLQAMEWSSVISPIWIITLLIFISGIPLLEKGNIKKYGHLPEYREYMKSSWRLIRGIY